MTPSPDDRDQFAGARDERADERERLADERERQADERERQADERDRQAAAREPAAPAPPPAEDGFFGIDFGPGRTPIKVSDPVDPKAPPPFGAKRKTKTLSERLAAAAAERGESADNKNE